MKQSIKIGLIGGGVEVLLSLIGIVETFSQRDIIYHIISMGHTLLLVMAVFIIYLTAKRTTPKEPFQILTNSLLSGLIIGSILSLLVIVGDWVNLRKVFINASPLLYQLLTFNQGIKVGSLLLLAGGG